MIACFPLVTSLYLISIKVEPWPSSLIFRRQQAVITSFTRETRGISLSRDHHLVQVSLARSNGAPALAGSYLLDMLHGATDFPVYENLVENGLQKVPLAGTAELEPGDLLGASPCPLLRVPVTSVLML